MSDKGARDGLANSTIVLGGWGGMEGKEYDYWTEEGLAAKGTVVE